MELKFEIEGGNFTGAGNASSEVKKTLKQLDVDNARIKRIVVALFEAEINVVAHADSGIITVMIDDEKVEMLVDDKGPGIYDISMAMQEGYSTATRKVREMGFGAGMGLPNIKRNTDEMNISSVLGVGTTLKMIVYLNDTH
jgi:serine/threonine-protein kinase RsbT